MTWWYEDRIESLQAEVVQLENALEQNLDEVKRLTTIIDAFREWAALIDAGKISHGYGSVLAAEIRNILGTNA